MIRGLPPVSPRLVAQVRSAIREGRDPLGESYCATVSAEERRPLGAVYTPPVIVEAMLAWVASAACPARIVDPGAGSGRFLLAAGRRFPRAELIAIEADPFAGIMARANIAAAGLRSRAQVILDDYRRIVLPAAAGQTAFVGNPPYVRHHLLGPQWKHWFPTTAREYGLQASQLAGLHVHFFLATVRLAQKEDVGVFITAAEWLDVNYGSIVRKLLLDVLGLKCLHVIEPAALPFPGTATTAVIAGFEVGARPPVVAWRRVSELNALGALCSERYVRRERLETAARWTPLTRTLTDKHEGFVELGELCRVHRGQVTGANRVWIAGAHSAGLPESVLFPCVTRARELFLADGGVLGDVSRLKQVIDLPVELDILDEESRAQVDQFLNHAKRLGADSGYIARHRKAWWSVGLREPAPILATYMARRPPAFVRNLASARHINIAHGLYPREPLSQPVLDALTTYLRRAVTVGQGRTYAGGLTKFEPGEMERILVPRPELLSLDASQGVTV